MKFSLWWYGEENWPGHGRSRCRPRSTSRIGLACRSGALNNIRFSKACQPSIRRMDRRPTEPPCRFHVQAAVVNENDLAGAHDFCSTAEEFGGRLRQPNVGRATDQEL